MKKLLTTVIALLTFALMANAQKGKRTHNLGGQDFGQQKHRMARSHRRKPTHNFGGQDFGQQKHRMARSHRRKSTHNLSGQGYNKTQKPVIKTSGKH